jgi:hypothetical protein
MSGQPRLAETIKYHVEILRLIWISFLATASGSIGILQSASDPLAIGVAIGGALGSCALLVVLFILDRRIRGMLRRVHE